MNQKEFKLLIGGQWIDGIATAEIRSPYDNSIAGIVHQAGPAHVQSSIVEAQKAFEITRRLPTYKRAEMLAKMVEGIKAQAEVLARTIALEAGKPIKNARAEVNRSLMTFTDAVEESKRIRGEWLPLDLDAASVGRVGLVRRFPVGPVSAITPFNFPLNLVSHKVAPALACGNTMVLKPASQTPLTALMLGQLALEAGVPPGTLNIITCPSSLAGPLITDDRIKHLSFTGSGSVGWALKQQAGKKSVGLELGGNAGVIIHSDANLDFAVQRCVAGSFGYAGQTCISVQRIYVHESLFDSFVSKFLSQASNLKVGNPLDETTDIGPMISLPEAERVEQWVNEAVTAGAKILLGGERSGTMVPPMVLTRTHPDMKVNCQEIFGPVVTVEPYKDFHTAVRAVNNSAYGLQAGVFTQDITSIFNCFEELEVGGIICNDVPTWRADPMPYGGLKDSGTGKEGVRYAIEQMTDQKILVLNLSK